MIIRSLLGTGPVRLRAVTAVLALATVPVGVFVALEAQLVVITALVVGMLVLEQRLESARNS